MESAHAQNVTPKTDNTTEDITHAPKKEAGQYVGVNSTEESGSDKSKISVEQGKGPSRPLEKTTSPVNGDVEKTRAPGEESPDDSSFKRFYRRHRALVHLAIWLVFTGWWIASLVLHHSDMNWVVPFLLYLCISLRLLFFWFPISVVTTPIHFIWNRTAVPVTQLIPQKWRIPLGALATIAIIVVGSFCSPEGEDNTRANRAISLLGLAIFIFVLWATSRNRKAINWHSVIVGMLAQFVVALFVLRTSVGYDIFHFISTLAEDLLGYANDGVEFLTSTATTKLGWFLTSTLPAVIFFVSIVQLIYYWGVLQWAVKRGAIFFFWLMNISGAEAVVAVASPFIGQGESAMLIKPFVPYLTIAELHQVMCSGYATISGSVLIAYIAMGVNAQALVSSCVMSIPASLAISKLRYPEEDVSITAERVVVPDDGEHKFVNSLHAFAHGAWLGLKIAVTIMANLLCIIALIGLVDALLTWWGRYLDIPDLTLEMIVGYICYPIAFLLGVPRGPDIYKVAKLIGMKLIANEFVAYTDLQTYDEYSDLSDRSRLIVTYALCGFANISSLGIQIGVLSQLSPKRSGEVAKIAVSALLSGALSTLTSASIAGLLVTNEKAYFSGSS